MIAIQNAREKYQPNKIKLLFVAESPPEDVKRFFYFEDVPEQDSLFLETMKVLYNVNEPAPLIRAKKKSYLEKFRDDGYYLEDALDHPIGVKRTKDKIAIIKKCRTPFMSKLAQTIDKSVPIILITRPVYDVLFNLLIQKGYNVLNTEMIDFPGRSGQPKFRLKMSNTLMLHYSILEATKNKRVCPQPQHWHAMFELLVFTLDQAGLPKPKPPLILAAWPETGPEMKALRLKEQLRWAASHGVLGEVHDLLISQKEEDWFHYGE